MPSIGVLDVRARAIAADLQQRTGADGAASGVSTPASSGPSGPATPTVPSMSALGTRTNYGAGRAPPRPSCG